VVRQAHKPGSLADRSRTSLVVVVQAGCKGSNMEIKNLNREQLMTLAQETYDKEQWSADDVYTLRACWEEFERRGFGQPVIFFRPAYFDVLKFHEIDSGEVGEYDVQMFERTGAEIASDYREIMRKLRGVDVAPYEKPKDLPNVDESDALKELMRITSQEDQSQSPIADLPGARHSCQADSNPYP
jgi:hypothetical protein